MNAFKRKFKNPHGGPTRKFSLYKRFFAFLKRLYQPHPSLHEHFVVSPGAQQYHHIKEENTLTWLGHSTFLIRLNGKTILTDPFLSEYASPIHGIGPKRFSAPGMQLHELPPIDMILVSHDHYDHCDLRTLNHLPNKSSIQVIAPLRLGKLFKKIGYQQVHELGWHDSHHHTHITVHGLPAYHYSKRHLLTRNKSLWLAYAIHCKETNTKLYFSGDTAYGSVFPFLGKEYGPFDYALVSIGAYAPEHLMLASHLSPEQAVQVGRDLRAETLVAMHWGTLILSDEHPFEPPSRFHHAAQTANYPHEHIWILNIGETRKIKNHAKSNNEQIIKFAR